MKVWSKFLMKRPQLGSNKNSGKKSLLPVGELEKKDGDDTVISSFGTCFLTLSDLLPGLYAEEERNI